MYRLGHRVDRRISVAVIAAVSVLSSAFCGPARGQEERKNRIDVQTLFTPAGWMGDGEYGRKYIDFSGANEDHPHSPPTSIKVTYTFGPARWGGVYWQNEPDNWGDQPGRNYSKQRLSRVTFWARGETGNEVVEFKAGGIDNAKKKHRDSFSVTAGRLTLSKEWKQYEIDLSDADLSSVIGGFCWVASADYNQAKTITLFLDDICFE